MGGVEQEFADFRETIQTADLTQEEAQRIKDALFLVLSHTAFALNSGNAPLVAACVEAARVLRTCYV